MHEEVSRSTNAVLNTIWAIFTQFIIVILGLFNRKIFLNYLGAELLGINSLFSDVLMIFSFADLGFGTAIMFSMYKPIAENNEKKVKSMLSYYRTIYRFVILALIIISFAFIPFLSFIKIQIGFKELLFYYILFQLNNTIEYLWAYRESYVIACQREREISKFNLFYNIIKNICQITIIFVSKSFISYLIIGFVCTISKKIFLNIYIKKHYPITILNNVDGLSKNEKKSIFKKSSALMITKVGNLAINQTDSIIVSYLISIAEWGYASNYLVIKKAIFTLSDKIYNAVLPSMGNLLVEKDINHHTRVFMKYDFINAWMHTFIFVSFLCLSSPFISLFFGEKAVLSNSFVFVFYFSSFIDGLRAPVSVMREAGGSFEQDKWYTVLAALVNVIVSIPFAMKVGLVGVYIGTICAMIVLHICRSYILLKDYKYSISPSKYLLILLKHIFVGLTICSINYFIIIYLDTFNINKYLLFMIKCFVVVILSNILWIFIYYKNQNMKEFINQFYDLKNRRN